MFAEKLLNSYKAVSFDEVYLVPGLAEADPRSIDLNTRFSTNVKLLIPIASSPMDTVTELDMAVALALLGGIGVVHRNMETDRQVEIVKTIKMLPPVRTRILYANIEEPCGRVLEVMYKHNVRNLPVVSNGKVVGCTHIADLKDSCRKGLEPIPVKPCGTFRVTEAVRARQELLKGTIDSVAFIDADGMYLGTFVFYDAFEDAQPAVDSEGRLVVGAAISPFDKTRAIKLDRFVDVLVSDVAHFHNVEVLKEAKALVNEIACDFIAGNIATNKAVEDIVNTLEKVDGFRVGLGGGSICTTPEVTGAYIPTLYAVAKVRDAVDKIAPKTPVIADGGLRSPSDITKALAAGASAAMLGYMLAGTDEASAPLISIGGVKYKPYRGMASEGAMSRRFAVDRYARVSKRVAEGVEGLVRYKGSVYNVVRNIIEAIKAGFGYVGARNIEELWLKAQFVIARKKHAEGLSLDI